MVFESGGGSLGYQNMKDDGSSSSGDDEPAKPDSTYSYQSYEEEIVTEEGVDGDDGEEYNEELVEEEDEIVVEDDGDAVGRGTAMNSPGYRGGQQVAPAPPQDYAPSSDRTTEFDATAKQRAAKVQEASEDKCLSSTTGLIAIGVLLFLAVAAICIGAGLGVAKPWEEENVVVTRGELDTSTAPSVAPDFPTFSPVEPSPEDEELLGLWESIVGSVIYEEGSPYYEASQWMLYRDPSRIADTSSPPVRFLRRAEKGNRRDQAEVEDRRSLQANETTDVVTAPTPIDFTVYTDDELDYIQRYLLTFLWYATTNNGKVVWESCNPVFPEFTEVDCQYKKAIRKLPDASIQYQPIPWKRWLSGADECDWAGITCSTNDQGRLVVTAIDLGGQGLEAPMEYIIELVKLPAIQSLRFPWNTIRGTLLPEVAALQELDLTDNFIQGPLIPLSGLSTLILEGNYLTGSLPVNLFAFDTPLQKLNVGRNLLMGGVPVEASFALKLTSLQVHENKLDGSIPPEIGQLPLKSLKLHGNFLQGLLPVDTINVNWLSTIEELWLYDNQLIGEIPSVLGSASRLLDLRLGGNRLSGSIPTEIYNLDRLYRLELASNALTGAIGIALVSQLTDLEVLDLSGNQLRGRILFDSRLSNLQSLKLEFNQFSGDVPSDLCEIVSLEMLSADCLPITSPPNPCQCCTVCCDSDTRTCLGSDGSPIAAPTPSPLPAPIAPLTDEPTAAPVPAPVDSPVEAPVEAPVTSPVASPVAAPVSSPVAAPTASPAVSPVASPVAAPVASPVASPVVASPVSGPISTSQAAVQSWARQTFGDSIDQESGSPHSLAAAWITSADTLGVVPTDDTFLQRYTLAHFYFSTRTWASCNPSGTSSCLYSQLVVGEDGALSYEQVADTRFLAGVSECDWVGISCSSNGNVTGIDLPGQEITGTLPVELSVLRLLNINLSYNVLSGGIPEKYELFTGLKSFLVQGNALTGDLPGTFCDLSSLTVLEADCEQVQCTCCSQCY